MSIATPNCHKLLLLVMVLSIVYLSSLAHAETDKALSSGETLYVPVYSNVYSGPKATPFQLATMLSIHNIDPRYSITILKVDYHDSTGKFIESYLKKPVSLKPFAHTFFYLKEYDTRGGPGANFIVKWRAGGDSLYLSRPDNQGTCRIGYGEIFHIFASIVRYVPC